jgi:hypothetical protein
MRKYFRKTSWLIDDENCHKTCKLKLFSDLFVAIMCKINWKTRIIRNLARKKSFYLHFLTKQSNWPELPRKWKMENSEVFLKNKWLECPKPIISWYHSIVGITIKRLVHIAGLQINPSSQNLSSKLKSGPNYPVWR